MEELLSVSARLIQQVEKKFVRSLMEDLDWTQPLIEIRGSRGVGKTTLLKQRAKQLKDSGAKPLYLSLDLPHFFNLSLFELAQSFQNYGGTHLFLDEVHRYPAKHKNSDWSLEIKNIVDTFPDLRVIYSGSSILHLYKGKGDLSRRKVSYVMHGLSFREYLEMNGIYKGEKKSLESLLSHHEDFALEVSQKIKPLLHFKEYLRIGYFPFYRNNEALYSDQLREVVNIIIDVDLPNVVAISSSAKEQMKRLLGAISTTVPYVPNLSKLSENLGITDHRTLLKYLHYLDEAQLIRLLRSESKGNKIMQKPDKIFLNNPNLIHALGLSETVKGTQRETFFYSQLIQNHSVSYPQKGDFKINSHYLFEVGGKNKSSSQIKNEKNAYIAADDIEIGFGNKIPLWLFGFLY